ncbi:hypothetical protein RJ641_009621 [Dillenia turbinata]|uniref:Uncharacterized protein n=1 Tax=Dillenia turbinata TaxID=194707 RepID=A0AAN8V0N9_9MAGN
MILAVILALFDPESFSKMMAPSGASSSEADVNQGKGPDKNEAGSSTAGPGFPFSVGGSGPSNRPPLDLNGPPVAELESASTSGSDLQAENLRLRQENFELRRQLTEVNEQIQAVLNEAERTVREAQERDRARDEARAIFQETIARDYSRIQRLENENARMRFQVNENHFQLKGKKGALISFPKFESGFHVLPSDPREYKFRFLFPMLSVGQQPTLYSSSLLVQEGLSFFSVWRESFFLNQSCLNWINSLISHNSSGYAFSSLLSIFPYAIMEMEYLGSAEF